RQLRLHKVSACYASVGSACSLRQHLAAVRLRVYNLLIKQRIVDRREPSLSWTNGVMTATCEDSVTRRDVRGPSVHARWNQTQITPAPSPSRSGRAGRAGTL